MPAHDKNSQTIKPQNQFSKGNTAFSTNCVRTSRIKRTNRKPNNQTKKLE